jgi:hypothetical protein
LVEVSSKFDRRKKRRKIKEYEKRGKKEERCNRRKRKERKYGVVCGVALEEGIVVEASLA